MVAVILEIIFELLFEVGGEVVSEFGLSAYGKTRNSNSIVVGFGYAIFGALLGLLTYSVFPHYLIQNEALSILTRLTSPIFLGFMLCLISWIISRRDRGEGIFRLDKFIHGIVFGVAYSLTRFVFFAAENPA